jgi:hypothetical protein
VQFGEGATPTEEDEDSPMTTPTRIYERKVDLPTDRADDWDLLEHVEAELRTRATQNRWRDAHTLVQFHDESGTSRVPSVSAARAAAKDSQYPIYWVSFRFEEAIPNNRARAVTGLLKDGVSESYSLTVSGLNRIEVLGLAAVLEEMLKSPPPPRSSLPPPPADTPKGIWQRLRRWWIGRQIGTQLLVGIIGGLITTGLIALAVVIF